MGLFSYKGDYTYEGRFPCPLSSITKHSKPTEPIDLVEYCHRKLGLVITVKVTEQKEAGFVIVPYEVPNQSTPKTVLARVYRVDPGIASVTPFVRFAKFEKLHRQHVSTIRLKRYVTIGKPVKPTLNIGHLPRDVRNTRRALAARPVQTASSFSVPQWYLATLLSGYTP